MPHIQNTAKSSRGFPIAIKKGLQTYPQMAQIPPGKAVSLTDEQWEIAKGKDCVLRWVADGTLMVDGQLAPAVAPPMAAASDVEADPVEVPGEARLPNTFEGIVGDKIAVLALGGITETAHILNLDKPLEDLQEFEGIGPKTAETIVAAAQATQ